MKTGPESKPGDSQSLTHRNRDLQDSLNHHIFVSVSLIGPLIESRSTPRDRFVLAPLAVRKWVDARSEDENNDTAVA